MMTARVIALSNTARFARRVALALGVCAAGYVSIAASVAEAQTVYKSVDDEGTVAFTDRPPEGYDVETVRGLDIDRSDRSRVTAANREAAEQRAAEQNTKQVRTQQDAEEKEINAAAQEERQANCEIANQRLSKYTEARRLYRDTGDGEREWLSDEEIDAARTKAALAVQKWCG